MWSLTDKVTYVFGEKNRVMFGSKEGRVTFYQISTKEIETYELP